MRSQVFVELTYELNSNENRKLGLNLNVGSELVEEGVRHTVGDNIFLIRKAPRY